MPQAVATQTAGWALLRMKLSATANPARPASSGAIHHQPISPPTAVSASARIAKQPKR